MFPDAKVKGDFHNKSGVSAAMPEGKRPMVEAKK
jgi:hypothetical protein